MQQVSAADDRLVRTHPRLTRAVRVELVSRSNENDIRAVIDTRDRSYDPERTGIEDGSVTVDTSADTLRTLSLSLVDRTGAWIPGADRPFWLDAVIRVYRGWEQTALWPQGVYEIMNPESTDRHRVHLTGSDKASRANGRDMGGFTTIVRIPKGTNLKTALTTLATYPTWNETQAVLAESALTTPYQIECTLSDYPWQKFSDLAAIPGDHRRYYDEIGRLRWHQDPDPNLLAPVYEVWPGFDRPGAALPGEYATYIGASRQIDVHGLKNWVCVRGGGGKSAPVFAEASDTSAASPTSVDRIGPRIYWHNGGRPDPLITTQAEAQARADYELRRLLQWQERTPLQMYALPFLQPWDVLRLANHQLGVNDNYQVIRYTLPLTRSTMTVEGWRPRRAA